MTKSTIEHVLSKAGLGGNFTASSARPASGCNALLLGVLLDKVIRGGSRIPRKRGRQPSRGVSTYDLPKFPKIA